MAFSFKCWWRQGVTLLWDLNALCKRSCAHARRPAVVLLLCWHQSLHQLRSPEQTFKVTGQHEKQVRFCRQGPSQSGDKWEESECLLPKWNCSVVKSFSVQLSCRDLAAVSTPTIRCALLSCDLVSLVVWFWARENRGVLRRWKCKIRFRLLFYWKFLPHRVPPTVSTTSICCTLLGSKTTTTGCFF